MQTTNVSTLKINKLTKEQYEREKAAGNINETELYLTPDEGLDASDISSGIISLDRLPVIPLEKGGTGAGDAATARANIGAAPAYTYGTEDLEAGVSELATGVIYLVYEEA